MNNKVILTIKHLQNKNICKHYLLNFNNIQKKKKLKKNNKIQKFTFYVDGIYNISNM